MYSSETEKNELVKKIIFFSDNFKIGYHESFPVIGEKKIHEEIEIKYYYDDSCVVIIENESYQTHAGDITIVNPYEMHTNVGVGDHMGKYIILMVGMDFLDTVNQNAFNLRRMLLEEGCKFNNIIRGDERLQTIILRVADELKKEEALYQLVVQNLMSEFFVLLFRNYQNKKIPRSKEASTDTRVFKQIQPALEKIHNDYSQRILVDELADICNISKFHFCKIFKSVMGVTAIQYLNQYRVNIADVFLENGHLPVSKIAQYCGFNDVSYFYRCYKKVKGYYPKRMDVNAKNQ